MILLYIDPGAGTWLVQAIIAAILAVGYSFRTVRESIKLLWAKMFRKRSD